jgi:transposase
MEALPIRFRSRVVQAYDKGEGTQVELAQRFGISVRWLQKLLAQRRQSDSIAPLPWNGGRRQKVAGDKVPRLLDAVAKAPDASLAELRDACDIDGSAMCVFRALRRLRITRKKRR